MTSQLEVVEETGVFGEKPPLNPKALATFSHTHAGQVRAQAVDKSKKHNIDVYKDLEIINIFHEKCNRSNEE